ncbi:MAG: taurine ABC transporter permease TauC [Chloroflexota bacterium]
MTSRPALRVEVTRWAVLLVLVLVVEAVTRLHMVQPTFVAQPTDVGAAFVGLLPQPLISALLVTLTETLASLVIAGGCGVLLGFALWRYNVLDRAFQAPLTALFASPTILLYPLFLVLFGRGAASVVAMAAVFAILPIALSTRTSLAGVSPTLLKLGRVMGLSTARIFRYILWPAAGPGIFSGLRLGLGYLLKSILAMEFLVNVGGLGTLVAESYDLFKTPDMYASILAVVLVSVAFVQVLGRWERSLQHGR